MIKHKPGGPNNNWCHLGHEVSFLFFSLLPFNNDITQLPHDAPHAFSIFAQALCHHCKLLIAGWQQVRFLDMANATSPPTGTTPARVMQMKTTPPVAYLSSDTDATWLRIE